MCARSKRASCSCQKISPSGSAAVFSSRLLQEPLAQLGGGGLGEGDDQQFVERRAFAFEAVEAAGDERLGLAGAGTGCDEGRIAARGDGALLR